MPKEKAKNVDKVELKLIWIKYVRMKNSKIKDIRPKTTYNPKNLILYMKDFILTSNFGLRLVNLHPDHNKHLALAFLKNVYQLNLMVLILLYYQYSKCTMQFLKYTPKALHTLQHLLEIFPM